MTIRDADMAPRTAALLAGFGLLAMAVLGIFANFVVLESMLVAGDASSTAANIRDSNGLFRLGIAAFVLVALLDVVVALGLYVLTRPVNASIALLAAWFRVAYAGILGVSLLNLVLASQIASGAAYLSVFEPEQSHAQVMFFLDSFRYGWLIGLVFFGIHLLVLGYMILKSSHMPSILGFLVILASLGYVTDSFASILMPNYADYETLFLVLVAVPAVIGELSLTFWLLFRGGKTEHAVIPVLQPA